MKSRNNSLAVTSILVGLLVLAVHFIVRYWLALRRKNLKRMLHSGLDRLQTGRRCIVRSWALRIPLRKELGALEARFNDYFSELIAHLAPHERELVMAHYRDAEMYLRRARIQRRLGRFRQARSLVTSANFMIDKACRQLPAERRIVWSEVCYV
jgi:hypothetical protein